MNPSRSKFILEIRSRRLKNFRTLKNPLKTYFHLFGEAKQHHHGRRKKQQNVRVFELPYEGHSSGNNRKFLLKLSNEERNVLNIISNITLEWSPYPLEDH